MADKHDIVLNTYQTGEEIQGNADIHDMDNSH